MAPEEANLLLPLPAETETLFWNSKNHTTLLNCSYKVIQLEYFILQLHTKSPACRPLGKRPVCVTVIQISLIGLVLTLRPRCAHWTLKFNILIEELK